MRSFRRGNRWKNPCCDICSGNGRGRRAGRHGRGSRSTTDGKSESDDERPSTSRACRTSTAQVGEKMEVADLNEERGSNPEEEEEEVDVVNVSSSTLTETDPMNQNTADGINDVFLLSEDTNSSESSHCFDRSHSETLESSDSLLPEEDSLQSPISLRSLSRETVSNNIEAFSNTKKYTNPFASQRNPTCHNTVRTVRMLEVTETTIPIIFPNTSKSRKVPEDTRVSDTQEDAYGTVGLCYGAKPSSHLKPHGAYSEHSSTSRNIGRRISKSKRDNLKRAKSNEVKIIDDTTSSEESEFLALHSNRSKKFLSFWTTTRKTRRNNEDISIQSLDSSTTTANMMASSLKREAKTELPLGTIPEILTTTSGASDTSSNCFLSSDEVDSTIDVSMNTNHKETSAATENEGDKKLKRFRARQEKFCEYSSDSSVAELERPRKRYKLSSRCKRFEPTVARALRKLKYSQHCQHIDPPENGYATGSASESETPPKKTKRQDSNKAEGHVKEQLKGEVSALKERVEDIVMSSLSEIYRQLDNLCLMENATPPKRPKIDNGDIPTEGQENPVNFRMGGRNTFLDHSYAMGSYNNDGSMLDDDSDSTIIRRTFYSLMPYGETKRKWTNPLQ